MDERANHIETILFSKTHEFRMLESLFYLYVRIIMVFFFNLLNLLLLFVISNLQLHLSTHLFKFCKIFGIPKKREKKKIHF